MEEVSANDEGSELENDVENYHNTADESNSKGERRKDEGAGAEDKDSCCYRCGLWLEDSSICCFLGPGSPVKGNHIRTHVIYLLLLLCTTIISCLAFVPKIRDAINAVGEFCTGSPLPRACNSLVPYLVIYRIGLIMAGFSFVMLLLLWRVSSAESPRAQFHSAFWFQKLSLLVLIGLGAYFIPHGTFEAIWMYAGLVGSFLTLLIQLVFIIDLSQTWNDFQEEKKNTPYFRLWYAMKVVTISVLYLTSVAVVLFLYIFFSKSDECKLNTILITVNVTLCVIASIISTLPKVRGACLLQASCVTIYTVYLTYCALDYELQTCDPLGPLPLDEALTASINGQSLITTVGLLVLLTYAYLRKHEESHLQFGQLVISRGDVFDTTTNHGVRELTTNDIKDNSESRDNSYSYSLFYFLFLLASLHIMMSLTHWYSPNANAGYWELSTNWTALYMKTMSSTMVVLLYIWTLVAPLLYPEENTKQILVLVKTLVKFIFKSLFTLLFKACPCWNQSKSTRFIYTFFLLAGTAISCIMYIPAMRSALESNPYFCNRISKLGNCLSMDPAYLAVYRICFAMAAFFFLFTLILYSVTHYGDPRALIHNGLWVVKFGLFFGLVLFTFFIPLEFSKIWMYIALLGTFIFITIQLFILLDLTKRWNSSWASKAEITGQKRWFYGILSVTVILYVLSALAVIIFYTFFTHSKHCRTNKMFTSMNLVLCIIATLVSIHPKVYECGLLQSSVATAYTMYLTWSAISYNPNEKCNPVAAYVSEVDMRPSLNVQATVDLLLVVAVVIYFSIYTISLTNTVKRIARTYATFIFGYKKNNRDESVLKDPLEISPLQPVQGTTPDLDTSENVQNSWNANSDDDKVPYSYSCFHFVYLMASLHVAMILTNWYSPKDSSHIKLIINWAAMCIKMTSSCFCMLLYIWSLVVPLLLQKREINTI